MDDLEVKNLLLETRIHGFKEELDEVKNSLTNELLQKVESEKRLAKLSDAKEDFELGNINQRKEIFEKRKMIKALQDQVTFWKMQKSQQEINSELQIEKKEELEAANCVLSHKIASYQSAYKELEEQLSFSKENMAQLQNLLCDSNKKISDSTMENANLQENLSKALLDLDLQSGSIAEANQRLEALRTKFDESENCNSIQAEEIEAFKVQQFLVASKLLSHEAYFQGEYISCLYLFYGF